jgi:hypothetical protein
LPEMPRRYFAQAQERNSRDSQSCVFSLAWCACAASGHATAAPPTSVMNSPRLMIVCPLIVSDTLVDGI